MELYQVIILSIIHGITEIAPISGYTHFMVIPWIFEWTNIVLFNIEFKTFIISLHLGVILGLIVCFQKEWRKLFKAGIQNKKENKSVKDKKIFWYIMLGTIPGGIILIILNSLFINKLATPIFTGIVTVLFGIILSYIDAKKETTQTFEKLTLKQGILIGLAQSLSFIPGVSSTTITIIVGRMLNIERKNILKYSFMILLPITIINLIMQCFNVIKFHIDFSIIIGIILTSVTTIWCVKWLLKYIEKKSFRFFANYRIIIGVIILAISFLNSELIWKIINSLDQEFYKQLVKLLY